MEDVVLPPTTYVGPRWDPVEGEYVEWSLNDDSALPTPARPAIRWQDRLPDPSWTVAGQVPTWSQQSHVQEKVMTYQGQEIRRYDTVPVIDNGGYWSDDEIVVIGWLLHFKVMTSNQVASLVTNWRKALKGLWDRGVVWSAVADDGTGYPDELTVWRLADPVATAQSFGDIGLVRFGNVPSPGWKPGMFPGHDVTAVEWALRMWQDHADSTSLIAGEAFASAEVLMGAAGRVKGDLVWVSAEGQRVIVEIQRRGVIRPKVNGWVKAMTSSDADDLPFVLYILVGQSKAGETTLYRTFQDMTDPLVCGLEHSRAARSKSMFVTWESWFPYPGVHTDRWADASVWNLTSRGVWESRSLFDVATPNEPVESPMAARSLVAFTPPWITPEPLSPATTV